MQFPFALNKEAQNDKSMQAVPLTKLRQWRHCTQHCNQQTLFSLTSVQLCLGLNTFYVACLPWQNP